MDKIALCFIINYDHILNKEHLWRKWIEPNKDIINVYFYYKDFRQIKSPWIASHTIPPSYIFKTSYYHMIPAYTSLFQFALKHDPANQWFCMLTDSCCPIVSPSYFRKTFFETKDTSLLSWKPAWWNPHFHKRGNLAKLPKHLWLANDPWFVLARPHVLYVLRYMVLNPRLAQTICNGGIANESLFAIILHQLPHIQSANTHITDWNRKSSPTSPHVFRHGDPTDIAYIEKERKKNKYALFLRKVAPEFPDEILHPYICENTIT